MEENELKSRSDNPAPPTLLILIVVFRTQCSFFPSVPSLQTPGRPKGVKEQDVYICDYRLDKSAHLFYKIHRNRYPVCTKPYAFDHFPKKLTPKRDFSVSSPSFAFLTFILEHQKGELNVDREYCSSETNRRRTNGGVGWEVVVSG